MRSLRPCLPGKTDSFTTWNCIINTSHIPTTRPTSAIYNTAKPNGEDAVNDGLLVVFSLALICLICFETHSAMLLDLVF